MQRSSSLSYFQNAPDLAIARNVRPGGARNLQLRVDRTEPGDQNPRGSGADSVLVLK